MNTQTLSLFLTYIPIVLVGIILLYALYIIFVSLKARKYHVVYIPVLVLTLLLTVWVSYSLINSRAVFNEYKLISDKENALKQQMQQLLDKVREQFAFKSNEKYILYKKGTISELYTIKAEESVQTLHHPVIQMSFQSAPRPVIADLSERQIKIDFTPFTSYEEVIRAIGVLQEYFVVDTLSVYQQTDKETGNTSYTLKTTLKQWEWGRATGVGNPYVVVYMFDEQGNKKKITEGYFWTIYPHLNREHAYFITRGGTQR